MAVIDLKTFNLLRESMGEEMIPALVTTFLRDTTAQIAQLREAAAAKDAENFRRAAHSLKSSAATMGASDLSALARELETMGQRNDLEARNRLEVLDEAFDLVKSALNEMNLP
jgi:HPt (histidine-containing phosphotransfer) domain-containing protein